MSEVGRYAELGVATVWEAAGRAGLVDLPLIRVVPESRAAGPARTVRCGQGDNLALHRALAEAQPGEVVVATMPEPEPVALLGDLMAELARARGVAAVLLDAAVRDRDEVAALGLPVWARWVRARGPAKDDPGTVGEPVQVGGVTIAAGDVVVLDGDGAVVVPAARAQEVLAAAEERAAREGGQRARLAAGEASLDVLGLRRPEA
jgi:4-hydroxy-4-methyl-2-oxoglutarate aldolase